MDLATNSVAVNCHYYCLDVELLGFRLSASEIPKCARLFAEAHSQKSA